MVQELRMDGELNNYSKYLVCVCVCVCGCVCVCVCVCVQSFQQDLQHITWCSLQVCPPQQMQELSVLFFVLCTTCMFPLSLLSCWCLWICVWRDSCRRLNLSHQCSSNWCAREVLSPQYCSRDQRISQLF